ncbi:hypothetical protein HHO41_16140 [Bacillus sp. DNRA2]|uniref:hypothetical protein n=1 Tax=Bacillus sp. DNRA2 TaxID=2723053 RepID=UPI00145C66A1|nr:hypothetical protein [Bacillus sp. DNRA2]NMD71829.1 hypothetical protein [Bacillus sp. DNRA2]
MSTWLIITCALLPQVLLVWDQSSRLQQDKTALHLLYDELERGIDESVTTGTRTVQLNGTAYEVSWSEGTSKTEVCVRHEDENKNVYQKCRSKE